VKFTRVQFRWERQKLGQVARPECPCIYVRASYRDRVVKIQNLLKTSSEWIKGDGGGNRIVFSSRLRLARNLNRHPFPGWAKKAEREKVLAVVQPAVADMPEMKDAIITSRRWKSRCSSSST
jgi:hypothetical protein